MEVLLAVGFTIWVVDSIVNNDDEPDLAIQNSIMTRITSNAITSVSTQCTTVVDTNQTINLQGNQEYNNALGALLRNDNLDTSQQCDSIVDEFNRILMTHDPSGRFSNYFREYTGIQDRHSVIYDMADEDTDQATGATTQTISQDGALARYMCEPLTNSVIVTGVQQVMTVNVDSNCTVDVDVSNTVKNSVSGYIDSTLTNDQDFAGLVMGSLGGSTQSISNSYSTIMGTFASTNITNILDNSVSATQNITFDNVSSMVATNFYQNSNIESAMMAEFVSQTNNDITQSVEYQLMQTLKNQNNTISDITGILIDGIEQMTDFIATTAGAYITIVVIIFVCGIFCLVNYRLYKDKMARKNTPQSSDESDTLSSRTQTHQKSLTQTQRTPFTQTPYSQTPYSQTPYSQTPYSQTPYSQTQTSHIQTSEKIYNKPVVTFTNDSDRPPPYNPDRYVNR